MTKGYDIRPGSRAPIWPTILENLSIRLPDPMLSQHVLSRRRQCPLVSDHERWRKQMFRSQATPRRPPSGRACQRIDGRFASVWFVNAFAIVILSMEAEVCGPSLWASSKVDPGDDDLLYKLSKEDVRDRRVE